MKRLRRFNLHNAQLLSNNELQNLIGGARGAVLCNTPNPCKFYVAALKEYIYGTCQEYDAGPAFYCYCKGNNLSGESPDCKYVI